MSFKQREAKRKKKAAVNAAITRKRQQSMKAARAKGDHKLGAKSREWWLTPVLETTCCARDGGVLRPGVDMVYRHTPRESLCVSCADADPGITYRPSVRWEQMRSKRWERKRDRQRRRKVME